MNQEFAAHGPDELCKIGKALFNASKQNVLDEQVQMTRLLESLAKTEILQYPFTARHTGTDSVPDFQLKSGAHRIAVEITKIAVPDVEHARALQNKGINRTLALSSLYRKKSKPRLKEGVVAEGFGTPPLVFPVSIDEHDNIWIESARASLIAKSIVIARSDFQRGDENWLLMWDRIGTVDWQLNLRINAFAKLLAEFWKPAWFSRVFVQDEDFFWASMFTPTDSIILPNHQ